MSYIKCTSCKKQVFKDYSNPNVHYSSKENDTKNFKCSWCENYESLKAGLHHLQNIFYFRMNEELKIEL
jgi:hypothetical protein